MHRGRRVSRKLVLRSLTGMVGGCSAILALAAGAAAAPAWLPAQNVREPVPDPGYIADVQLAGDTAGNTIAVWTRLDTKGDSSPANDVSVIETAFRPSGGSFGAAQVISGNELTSPPRDSSSPDVGMDELGRALVVWRHHNGINSVVRARVRGSDGTLGPISEVSAVGPNIDAAAPEVAVNATGQAAVVWEQVSPNQVYGTTGSVGGGFAAPTQVSATGSPIVGATVAVDAAGNTIFAWERDVSALRWLIEARAKPAVGAFGPVALLSPEQDHKKAEFPRVALDSAGRATVVWSFRDEDPNNNGVPGDDTDTSVIRFATRSVSPSWAEGSFGLAATIPSPATEGNLRPDVAVDAGGTAVVIWTRTIGGQPAVVQSASRPSGGSFGNLQTLSEPGLEIVGTRLTMGPTGDAMAAWHALAGTTAVSQAARRPAGSATSFGVDEDVDRITPSAGGFAVIDGVPELATDSEGNVIGARTGLVCSATSVCERSARYAAFDAAPPTITSVTVPGSAAVGQPFALSATAFDRVSGSSTAWAFGDGGVASGATASHAFAAPGAYNVSVTATDAVGNASSQTRGIHVAGSPPPPPPQTGRVKGSVVFRAQPRRRHTVFARLLVRGASSPRSRVRVICRGSRRCPFGRRGRTFTPRRGEVTLNRAFRNRRLRPGTVIEVRITAPGLIGKVVRIQVRRARAPMRTALCLPPGTARPQRRC
jgi:PKD domain